MTPLFVTRGLVLGKRGVGEESVLVAILTEDGLLKASARSARRERSKLRYALEPFTHARYTLVRGRWEWKLIGAEDVECSAALEPSVRAALGRLARLLQRLLPGEEKAPQLFRVVVEGAALLAQARGKEALESVECVLVLRVLFQLGYLPKTPELAPFVEEGAFSLELAAVAAARRSTLIRTINESLQATGL